MGRMSKRSLAMKEAWARRKAQQANEGSEESSITIDRNGTRTVRKSSFDLELSKNLFTLEQIQELGFYGFTNDGRTYRLLMREGRPVQ